MFSNYVKNPKTNLIMIINHPFVILLEFQKPAISLTIASQFIYQIIIVLVVYRITGLHPTLKTKKIAYK